LLQGKASKTKGIQIKKLAFPWIPLVESRLFNGLRRIQIKKSATLSETRPGCKNKEARLLEARGIHTPSAFVHGLTLAEISALRKQMSRLVAPQLVSRSAREAQGCRRCDG
jgi:hypothetical protein